MEKIEFKMDPLDASAEDGDHSILGIVDDNSVASQDILNPTEGEEDVQYAVRSSDNGMVTYRVVRLAAEGDTHMEDTTTNITATSNTIHPAQCQFYVIGNPTDFVQTQRNISPKTDVNVLPIIQHNNVRKRDERRRATHNEVERRRRDKINNWIMKLGKIIPDTNSDGNRPTVSNTAGHFEGQSKGGILAKACEYITELKKTNESLNEYRTELGSVLMENKLLREKNDKLKKDNDVLRALISQHGIVPAPDSCSDS